MSPASPLHIVSTDRHAPPSEEVFERAADIFRLMSTPVRLQIISSLCAGEKNVSEILGEIATTQPNLSQHLNVLYRAEILARERRGNQVFYRIHNHDVVALCRTLCGMLTADQDQHAHAP
ncbi:ArsR/SmtB family transcription factor [Comamonas flocculans]|uniref:Winged helix-turn-helix transcriptional regulator n=1 Tax=Comamonas flocculans TaxID=2597701 RepID=A0A5B8RYI9_9BURK|nr:metalloregulator ArsR/SmtB family transcription factor [Comamonas flocculans]QEA14213.1 winged helix-turn-helix transcriptional regulator [Comamonas flocculans]